MDRIVLTPEHVRGLGNIIGDKSIGDFAGRYCTVSSATDTVGGQSESVWKTTRTNQAYSLSVDYPVKVSTNTDFDVSVSVSSGTVFFYCIWNNEVYSTDSKVSSHTFSLPAVMSGRNTVTVYCSSTDGGSVLASRSVPIIIDDTSSTVKVVDTLNLTESGMSTDVFAEYKVGDVGVPWNTVYFYEVYDKLLRWLRSNPSMVESDSTVDVGALLVDSDGSRVPNETVYFYEAYEGVRINLTRNVNILESGDTLSLSAKVRDGDESIITGEAVSFYRNGELLGTGESDSTGVATYEYTGTGFDGEGVSFTAEYGDGVSRGVNVADYILYDSGVTGSAVDKYTYGSNITRSVSENGTKFTNTSGGGAYVYFGASGGYSQNNEYTFEFYTVSHNFVQFGVQVGDNKYPASTSNDGVTCKLTVKNKVAKFYIDNELDTTRTITGDSNLKFYLRTGNSEGNYITVRDVRLYLNDKIQLTSSNSSITTSDSVSLTATLNRALPAGKEVLFDIYKNGQNITTLTGTTNSSGEATATFSPTVAGEYTIKTTYQDIESNTITITVT